LHPRAAAATEQVRADDCKARIIVRLAQAEPPPNEIFVTDLARAVGVQLALIRTVTPGLYVFSLASAESDPGCREALERLRRDARVRSAEIDARRARHAPGLELQQLA
jgi:hypothetical protein